MVEPFLQVDPTQSYAENTKGSISDFIGFVIKTLQIYLKQQKQIL